MADLEELSLNAEAFSMLQEISSLLNTNLSNEELLACFKMLEGGADPTALALLVRQIKSDAAALKAGSDQSAHPQENVSNENQPSS